MVKYGNPEHITDLASLAGKSVSVEVGTTNKDFLDAQSKKLKEAGKKRSRRQSFPKDTDAAAALKTGRVDAYFGDSPVVAYYIAKDKSFAIRRLADQPAPDRDRDPQGRRALKASVQKAIKKLYANGTMKKILAKWEMSAPSLLK